MEALKLIQSTNDGVLRIEVPDHFRNTRLEVIVTPLHADSSNNSSGISSIEKYFGTAKYPQTQITETDVYKQ